MDGFHGSAVPDGELRAPRVSFTNITARRAGSFGTKGGTASLDFAIRRRLAMRFQ